MEYNKEMEALYDLNAKELNKIIDFIRYPIPDKEGDEANKNFILRYFLF